MQGLAGPVALALVGLWVVYLVPQVLRHRQQLLDSRADDRYSGALRVVAVTRRPAAAGRVRTPGRAARRHRARVDCAGSRHTTGLLTPGRGVRTLRIANEGGATVDRPPATGQHVSLEASRERARAQAAFAAAVSRRGAAARRRGVLAAMLALVSVAAWAGVVAVPSATWVVGAVPSALLVLVVGLGRAAVVSGVRHDAQWREIIAGLDAGRRPTAAAGAASRPDVRAATARPQPARTEAARTPAARTQASPHSGSVEHVAPAPRSAVGPRRPNADLATTAIPVSGAQVVGRAVRGSQTPTDVFDVIVSDRGETGTAARHASGATPVVAQAQPEVAEREDAWSPVPVPPPTYVLKPAAPHREPAPLTDDVPAQAVVGEAEVRTTGSIDLDAVLERRRASGQ